MRLIHDLDGHWVGRSALAGKIPGARPPVAFADARTVEADGPPVSIAVLANDIDPEGGALTLVSAFAGLGTAVAEADGTVTYTPPAGITGFDTITYEISDPTGLTDTGQVDIELAAPALSVTVTPDNRLEVEAASAPIDITLSDPAAFAATYMRDLGLLAAGPVLLAPPVIAGTIAEGETLAATPGLWINDTAGTPARGWQWQRDGADIAGATGASLVLGAGDLNSVLTAIETLSDATGSRSATSNGLGTATFGPGADGGVQAWFDAAEAATITASGGAVSNWASRVGSPALVQASGPDRPVTGARSIGGLNAIDFPGSQFMTGSLTLPAGDHLALHMAVAIDGASNAFAGLVSMDGAASDFQLDAEAASGFDGRLNLAGAGTSVSLAGGPFSGPQIVQIVFDLTGGTAEVFIGNVSRGSTAMSAALDTSQVLGLFTNRSGNASVDGAAGEAVVTTTVTNRPDYYSYLSTKWGIS